jgi:hypothetical protein
MRLLAGAQHSVERKVILEDFEWRWSFLASPVRQPEALNRVGFRLYERWRPDVPEGAQGWGA